jgi:hypothetical protein
MPNEKQGTIVADFSTYAKKEEKGIELKLDGEGRSKKGATLRVVVGKVPQSQPRPFSPLILTNSSIKTITISKPISQH